jgi:ATP phosphoribosyltransferase
MTPLKFGIPKGSLERATIELLRKSGWRVSASDERSYFPSIDDDEIVCSMVRAQEMSRYVELGCLDCGITGKDWTLENGSDVEVVCDLVYSKESLRPTRWVLAVPADSVLSKASDLQGKRVSTELVRYTERFFAERNVRVSVEFSWGATEAKVAAGLCDAIVEATETGTTLRANGLKIIDEIMVSAPQVIANREALKDRPKRNKIEQIALMMRGALRAQGQVGIKLNVRSSDLPRVIALLPSITAPTVANLYGTDWVSVESVVSESVVRDLAPELVAAGAEGIIEYPLNKII